MKPSFFLFLDTHTTNDECLNACMVTPAWLAFPSAIHEK